MADEGWYPDPAGPGRQRWWDGRLWTEWTRPLQPRQLQAWWILAAVVAAFVFLVVAYATHPM